MKEKEKLGEHHSGSKRRGLRFVKEAILFLLGSQLSPQALNGKQPQSSFASRGAAPSPLPTVASGRTYAWLRGPLGLLEEQQSS